MILLRTAQVQVDFETCNLRLDCCELAREPADLQALARQQLLLLAFHDALHMRSNAIALPLANAWQSMLAVTAPQIFPYLTREYADSGVVRLSGSQQNGKNFLNYVKAVPYVEGLET